MTSSEKATDDDLPDGADEELPAAVARDRRADEPPPDPDRWIRRGILVAAIVAGWAFIAWAHRFHVGPAVAFLSLGWLAVVAGVHNLWRTGTATADPVDEEAAWWRPTGARDELEREKRSLLKAIKEVEFDLQTGKMSPKDAEAITRVYRARAIEVIKAMDELDARGGRSIRQQIEIEVKARLAIEGSARKGEAAAKDKEARKAAAREQAKQKARGKGGGSKPAAKADDKPAPAAKADDKPAPKADDKPAAQTSREAS
jgi:hypothetical protein